MRHRFFFTATIFFLSPFLCANEVENFQLTLSTSYLKYLEIALNNDLQPIKTDSQIVQKDSNNDDIVSPILPIDEQPSTLPLPPPQRIFTLNEAISETLKFQDEIEISELEVIHQGGVALQDAGPFDPVIDADLTRIKTQHVQSLSLGLKTDQGAQQLIGNIAVTKKTRLGTLFHFSLHGDRAVNPLFPLEGFAPSNKVDQTAIAFQIEQPLLRDFWNGNDTMIERAAYMDLRATTYDNLQNISKRVLDTILNYWEWVAALKLLSIRQNAEERISNLVNSTYELIKKNQVAANDINQPLAQLATQKINTITARQNLYNAFQELKFSMGITDIAFCVDVEDWGSDDFSEEIDSFDIGCYLNSLLTYATQARFDIQASIFREASFSYLLKGAYNNSLPKLNIFGGVRQENFTLGDKADGLYSAVNARKPETNWEVGVRFSTPLYNDTAEGQIRQLKARLSQTHLQTHLITQRTIKDIQETLTTYFSLTSSLEQAQLAVQRNQTLVENEKEKIQGGFSTIFFLIDFENRLTDALAEYIEIQKEYMQNIARLRYFSATLVTRGDSPISIIIENPSFLPKE